MTNGMTINGATRFGGLIGKSVAHSLSPLIHNSSAALLGIDAVYLAFDLSSPPSSAFFESMFNANCFGFNVTVPYKEKVSAALSSSAGSMTSVNTIYRGQEQWQLTSTDADGFAAGLLEIDRKFADFSAIILLGYGGAAKALLTKIRAVVPQTPLFVLKRTKPIGGELSEFKGLELKDFENEELSAVLKNYPNSLVIQCSSAPLRGDDLARFVPSLSHLKGAFVDLVYGKPSALLIESEKRKILCQDGIPMLIHQALLSQKLWWGQSASFSAMKTAIARQR